MYRIGTTQKMYLGATNELLGEITQPDIPEFQAIAGKPNTTDSEEYRVDRGENCK